MKKLLTVILILALALPALALADLPDVSGYTDQELKDLIAMCSAELATRHISEPEGILLFEYEGAKMYQIEDAYINNKNQIVVPVLIVNDRDIATSLDAEDATCNGWMIKTYTDFIYITEKSRTKGTITFQTEDIGIKSLDDITSLVFRWTAGEGFMYVYKGEREEYRFW